MNDDRTRTTNQHNICANAVRVLGLAAIEQAQSGHPGVVLGFSDVLTVLWRQHMRYDVTLPTWSNRDRFVLSNGHASALYYAILHCAGFELSMDDLRLFRQYGSKTPGHPERDARLGIDVTTGPLGQGLANAVGIAMAERFLHSKTETSDGDHAIGFHTYAAVGDGCLMEGISHEASALAGRFGLGKLIVCWDDNQISIDGCIDQWAECSVVDRFKSYGWQVIEDVDGHDPDAIDVALREAKACDAQPSLIAFKTQIGRGTEWAGTATVHGKPLGAQRFSDFKQSIEWTLPDFTLSDDIYSAWQSEQLTPQKSQWKARVESIKDPVWHAYFRDIDFLGKTHTLPDEWKLLWASWLEDETLLVSSPQATRHSSQACLQRLVDAMPNLIGGSADLAESTGVLLSKTHTWRVDADPEQFLHFGVREFAMFAMANGMASCCGLRPFVSTFLVFSDYGINALRMAALMKLPVIFIFSHDSVFVGEDGPTHQPIEQLAHLRSIPGLDVWRPADTTETAIAWKEALSRHDGPSCLILTRQKLAMFSRGDFQWHVQYGASRLDSHGNACDGVLIATGSEVRLAYEVQMQLVDEGIQVAVVSLVCWERFQRAPEGYRSAILPESGFRLVIEAGSSSAWYQLIQNRIGAVFGIDEFGQSGPGQQVYRACGFSVEAVVDQARLLHQQCVAAT
ncbi:MAG: transketolase [Legionellales bacterium]|nr:transketolase [Legionellales bacterium]